MKGQNPWLRNYVAFTGLLGSVRPEIIYLETMHDDSDTPLLGMNDYILKGIAPIADIGVLLLMIFIMNELNLMNKLLQVHTERY